MEGETDEPRCNAVYFCASYHDDIAALYHTHAPPPNATATKDNDKSLDLIYHNVRILLDQDRGAFKEVYLTSSVERCLDRLDVYANSSPTIVLVEVTESDSDTTRQQQNTKNGTDFLRILRTNIQGARYQKDVLPFALLVGHTSPSLESLKPESTAFFLKAGAGDLIASPITSRGINHLVGHVMERTRPPARFIGSSMAQNLVESIRETGIDKQPYHRPDETISEERRKFVEHSVNQWAFPAHELDMDELTYAAVLMLEHVLRDDAMSHYRLSRAELMAFVLATRRQYKHEREVYYHNWRHAVDVTQSIYQFLTAIGLCPPADPNEAARKKRTSVELLFSSLDGLMLLVSAIGHDVGHPGVNNAFLVACNHPLAQLYNDKSVLENYHCAAYSQLLRRHWPSLSKYPDFRQTLISNILATDMQRHFEYMSHLTDLRDKLLESDMSIEDWSDKEKDSTRELMTALMMKAADISNIARPFDISAAWAKILVNEFASQGELESELELPTCLFGGPPDKEDLLAAAQSQKGFMNLFGLPLFQGLSDVVPSISCSVDTLLENQKSWDERIAAETEKRQSPAHVTFQSLGSDRDMDILQKHHQSEPTAVATETDSPAPSTPIRWQPGRNNSGSPVRQPATDEKKRLVAGFSTREDGKRASAPILGGPGSLLVAPGNAASRRSSKDVALDQLQHLSMFAHQGNNAGSRRGSVDAAYQLNHSYPPSRRGSKDESLTTILVTSSQGSPGTRSGHVRHSSSSPHKRTISSKQAPRKPTGTRNSVPSSHSHAASSGTATTGGTEQSPSTQPSSVAPIDDDHDDDDDDESPTVQLSSSSQSHDPFLVSSSKSSQADSAATPAATSTGSLLDLSANNGKDVGTSPRIKPQTTREDVNEHSPRTTPGRDGHNGLRESRSRSRLRSLKFWKKKKETTDDATSGTP